jgi:hypothetical protein
VTFDQLRATIAAEMPPGWRLRNLRRDCWDTFPGDVWSAYVRIPDCDCYQYISAPTPEALLSAWREMKGKLA